MFCKQMDIPNHSYGYLLQFRVEVANGLLLAKKEQKKRQLVSLKKSIFLQLSKSAVYRWK